MRSISSTSANATAQATASALISIASLSQSLRVELLRIVDAGNPRFWREDHGRGRHRPGERAHAGFVDAGDVQNARGPKRALELQELAQSLPLRAIFGAPPRDGVQNASCARPRIGPQGGFRVAIERFCLVDVAATDRCERQACHSRQSSRVCAGDNRQRVEDARRARLARQGGETAPAPIKKPARRAVILRACFKSPPALAAAAASARRRCAFLQAWSKSRARAAPHHGCLGRATAP